MFYYYYCILYYKLKSHAIYNDLIHFSLLLSLILLFFLEITVWNKKKNNVKKYNIVNILFYVVMIISNFPTIWLYKQSHRVAHSHFTKTRHYFFDYRYIHLRSKNDQKIKKNTLNIKFLSFPLRIIKIVQYFKK